MLAYSSVKMQSHDAIFHPIFSSNSLSTKIIPCDYLIESEVLKWIENLKCVQFLIISLMRIMTSQ